MQFHDRFDAGRQLGERLADSRHRADVSVAALRPSAVPVAHAVAAFLGVPLDTLPVASIDVRGRPGAVIGALAFRGPEVLDEKAIAALDIPRAVVRQEAARARLALERSSFVAMRAPLSRAPGLTVVLVDDALLDPAAPEAATLAARTLGADRVVVAAPAGRADVVRRLATVADEVVCLAVSDALRSAADAFQQHPDISDVELRTYLHAPGPPGMQNRGDPVDVVRRRATPLDGDRADYDALIEHIGHARVVMIGESTHGTHEFYRERARITRRLIEEKHFNAVAVEADWPDAYRVNHFVRGSGHDADAAEALGGFRRFPAWMWRNADVLDFVGWLRTHNDGLSPSRRTGFYGLDLYSLRASMDAVLAYLDKVDPDAAGRARLRYACFDRFDRGMESYAYLAGSGMTRSCETAVLGQLMELHRRRADYASRDGRIAPDEFFFAEQNARLVRNAEQYYRTMLRGREESWNVRDRHMAETLQHLAAFLDLTQPGARIVVWAHNSHVGDARATSVGGQGELTLGQLAREHLGRDVVLVGFTTSAGTVTAASDWDGPAERKEVRVPLPGSYERLFRDTGVPRFLLPLRTDPELARALSTPRLERAIGVLYLPHTERASHYFHARLAGQFDFVVHIDVTRAVEPLERTSAWEQPELAETYPSGL